MHISVFQYILINYFFLCQSTNWAVRGLKSSSEQFNEKSDLAYFGWLYKQNKITSKNLYIFLETQRMQINFAPYWNIHRIKSFMFFILYSTWQIFSTKKTEYIQIKAIIIEETIYLKLRMYHASYRQNKQNTSYTF